MKNEIYGKRIKEFVLKLIRFVDGLPRTTTSNVIADQLLRSGTSIGANYFEAKAASSRSDFSNYLRHALKSSNECKYWLELLIESDKCSGNDVRELLNEVSELGSILASSLITLKRNTAASIQG